MAGSTTWPSATPDAFALPVAGELLVGPVTAPSSVQVGSIGLAVEAIEAWLISSPVNTNTSSGTTETLPDTTVNPMTALTLTANCVLTFPAATAGKGFMLQLIQDATGSRTVTWPSVRWPGGTPPVLSTPGGSIDIFTFVCFGTHWYGFVCGQAMA